jgi:NADH dehydrogenase
VHRIVVVGGGFGGLSVARRLARADGVDVTVVDKRNFHLFQPLLYQVATGALSPGDVAAPLREVLRKSDHTRVLLGETIDVDVENRRVIVRDSAASAARSGEAPAEQSIPYDTLVVAAGESGWRRTSWGCRWPAAQGRRLTFRYWVQSFGDTDSANSGTSEEAP